MDGQNTFAALVLLIVFQFSRAENAYDRLMKKFDVQPLDDGNIKSGEEETDFFLTLNQVQNDSVSCQLPQDCEEVKNCGRPKSGVYRVFPFGMGRGFLVYCDMTTRGGGWLVFQRRQDGSVDFKRDWKSYSDGFGNLVGEFWLGLDKLHILTSQRRYELLVNLIKYDKGENHETYDRFYISGKPEKYRILLGRFSGPAGNGLDVHNGCMFSTPDTDNDYLGTENCAATRSSGWWFNKCDSSNLNGVYLYVNQKTMSPRTSVNWYQWGNNDQPMQLTEMKIRPHKPDIAD